MSESLNTTEPWGLLVRGSSRYADANPPTGNTIGSYTTQTFGPSWQYNIANTRTGFQNPRWKDQCRLGVSATTTFSGTSISGSPIWYTGYYIGKGFRSNGSIQRWWDYSGWGFPYLSYVPTSVNVPASVVTDVHNRCIRKFIQEVTEAQSSENLTGRSIKHLKHDIHSTLHPMQGIRDKISGYLTTLEKVPYGKLRGPGLYNTLTSAYLEFKFGVEPFVDDITAIVSDMVIRDRKRNPSVPVQATAHAIFNGSTVRDQFSDASFLGQLLNISCNVSQTSTYSERIKGAVRTGINDDGRLGVIQDNRLLPKDWLPTAFSIMPYAWMVNYFTNIGDIIDAACFRFSDVVWACLTERSVARAAYSAPFAHAPNPIGSGTNFAGGTNFAMQVDGNSSTFEYKKITRTALIPSELVPDFTFTVPSGPTPWVNMMAAFSPRILGVVSRLFS